MLLRSKTGANLTSFRQSQNKTHECSKINLVAVLLHSTRKKKYLSGEGHQTSKSTVFLFTTIQKNSYDKKIDIYVVIGGVADKLQHKGKGTIEVTKRFP
jgi:hypothetical protein